MMAMQKKPLRFRSFAVRMPVQNTASHTAATGTATRQSHTSGCPMPSSTA